MPEGERYDQMELKLNGVEKNLNLLPKQDLIDLFNNPNKVRAMLKEVEENIAHAVANNQTGIFPNVFLRNYIMNELHLDPETKHYEIFRRMLGLTSASSDEDLKLHLEESAFAKQ